MLVRIEVSNYKSIGQTALQLHEQNVIVGPNGSGKSNLLDVIHFLRDAATDGLDHAVTKRHGILSIRRWSKTRPFNIVLKVSFESDGNYGDYRVTIASAGEDFSVIDEEGTWFSPPPFRSSRDDDLPDRVLHVFKRSADGSTELSLPGSPFEVNPTPTVQKSELLLTQFGPSSASPTSFFFRQLYQEIVSCGAYSIYPNRIREPQTISNSDILADDGTNLASIIRQMRNSRANREALTSALKQVLPIVREIHVKSAGGFYVPVFRVGETTEGNLHDLNMAQISDGTLRMLGMLTAFYQPKAPVRITLEEPEQMIHPGLLPVLVDAIGDYTFDSTPKRQVIITTHSPNLLDLFPPEAIIGARFEDGVSQFAPISSRQLQIVKERLFSAGDLLVTEGILN